MAGTHDLSRDPILVPRKLTFVCTSEADAKPLPPGASRRVGREEDKAVFEVEVDMSGVATFGDGCKLALNEIVGIGNHDARRGETHWEDDRVELARPEITGLRKF